MNNPLNFGLTCAIPKNTADITMSAYWTPSEQSPIFIAYLMGYNSLTGEKVERELCRFSVGFTSVPKRTLPYHGTYTIQVRMQLQDEPPVVCYETQIKLTNPRVQPKLCYNVEKQDGFTHITIECNCWKFSRGKVWLVFDGQRQPLILKKQRCDFYLAASEFTDVEITDPTIEKERGQF